MKIRKSDQGKFEKAYAIIVQENYLRDGSIRQLSHILHVNEKRLLQWFSHMLKDMGKQPHHCPLCGALQNVSNNHLKTQSF